MDKTITWDHDEDSEELNKETMQEVEQARVDIKVGKFYTHEQTMKRH